MIAARSGPSMKLAEIALQPKKRGMLLDAEEAFARGHALPGNGSAGRKEDFPSVPLSLLPSPSCNIIFISRPDRSANVIREKASVLVAPGAYPGRRTILRITVGYEPAEGENGVGENRGGGGGPGADPCPASVRG